MRYLLLSHLLRRDGAFPVLYVPVPTARVEGATFVWKILLEKYEKEAMWFFLLFFFTAETSAACAG